MNSLKLGNAKMWRSYIPRCTSCVRHGYVSRDCALCGGSGYFCGCDNCDRELIAHDATCYVVDRGFDKLFICEAPQCLADVLEECCPTEGRMVEMGDDFRRAS